MPGLFWNPEASGEINNRYNLHIRTYESALITSQQSNFIDVTVPNKNVDKSG